MFNILVKSRKCRLPSYLKTIYNLPPYYISETNKSIEMHKKLLDDTKYKDILEMYSFTWNQNETLIEFNKHLTSKSMDIFKITSYYYRNNFKIVELWKIVLKMDKSDFIKSVKYFWSKMTHSERPIYLYTAILYILHKDSIEVSTLNDDSFELPSLPKFTDKDIPDYVYDVHTGNKNKNKTMVDFALEGSLIINEDTKFLETEYKEFYIKNKRLLNNNPSIYDELNNESVIRGQKLTSGYKPYVYIPTKGKYKDFVWKGPFVSNTKRIIMWQFRTALFRYLESSVVLGTLVSNEWIKYPFIGKSLKDLKYTNFYDSLSNSNIKELDRSSIGQDQLSSIDSDLQYEILFGKEFFITTFIDASLLYTGDTGPWNTIIYNNKCWLIDYEDSSGKDSITEFSDIFARPILRNHIIKALKNDSIKNKITIHLKHRLEQIPEMLKISSQYNTRIHFKTHDWDPTIRINEFLHLLL